MKNRRAIARAQQKSSDGEFLYELTHSYELSPKLSEQLLLSAKQHLLRESGQVSEGQIEVTVVGIEEKSGKLVERVAKKKVRLTLDAGMEDVEVRNELGRRALRQIRIQRMTEEAIDQAGVLSQEDLSKYLLTSVRTIKRDIDEIRRSGVEVITRGVLHNIGRGQTHKVKIVRMYLDGMTYSELQRKTRHSVGAIKRYLDHFTKVVMAQQHGIRRIRDVSAVTGLSEHLVGQYQALVAESKRDRVRGGNLQDLVDRARPIDSVERARYRDGIKKTLKTSGNGVVPMIGGSR